MGHLTNPQTNFIMSRMSSICVVQQIKPIFPVYLKIAAKKFKIHQDNYKWPSLAINHTYNTLFIWFRSSILLKAILGACLMCNIHTLTLDLSVFMNVRLVGGTSSSHLFGALPDPSVWVRFCLVAAIRVFVSILLFLACALQTAWYLFNISKLLDCRALILTMTCLHEISHWLSDIKLTSYNAYTNKQMTSINT